MEKDERFWLKVEKTDSCWIWTGFLNKKGYGHYWSKKEEKFVTLKAHRVAYEMVKGKIPDGLVIDHLCRMRSCVNPEHLEAVTNRENVVRGLGGKVKNETHCSKGHELSGDNLKIKRKKSRNYVPYRFCVQCAREIERRRYWRNKAKKK